MGFGEITDRLRRSTVQVGAGGSGIIWDGHGTVITNAHVAGGPHARIQLWDGTRLQADVRQRDVAADLAELQVAASDLPAASIADGGNLRIGELAIAVGNPLGFTGAVSTGVVHAVGPLKGLGNRAWVQSSVRLAPGNSGGPLANARGQVIGVNTMILNGGAGRTLALAIPSAVVVRFIQQSEVSIGVTVRPAALPSRNGLGFLILETQPGRPADTASLMMGDLLTGADGHPFQTSSALQDALRNATNGRLSLQFQRGGSPPTRTAYLQLGKREAAAA